MTLKKHLFLVIMFIVAYKLTSIPFYYMDMLWEPNLFKILLGLIIFFITYSFTLVLKPGLIWGIWHISFICIFTPTLIYYVFNSNCSIVVLVSKSIFFICLAIFSQLNLKLKTFTFRLQNDKPFTNIIILGVSIIMFAPFYNYLKYIDLTNLFFQNVYETRLLFRTLEASTLSAYLYMPLSRVILPVSIIKSIEGKNFFSLSISIVLLLLLYLMGALKSVFLGLLLVIAFYKGKIISKVLRFYNGLIIIIFASVFEYIIFNSYIIIDFIIRRIFFIPSRLESYYVNYFSSNNYTLWSHNKLGNLFFEYPLDKPLSFFVGENLINNEGLNANIGFIIEGFVALGFSGVLLHSIAMSLIFLFFQSLRPNNIYFGLFLIVVYSMNTSFLLNLLFSHGLLFLLVFSYFFLKESEKHYQK